MITIGNYDKSKKETKEKIILTFNNTTIHSLKELRENFNKEDIIKVFMNNDLYTWLKQHYYDYEAEKIKYLKVENKDFFRKLCDALNVNYYNSLSEEEKNNIERKKQIILKCTTDKEVLQELYRVATNQEELADLLDKGENKIYLCNESFSIPINVPNKEYICIGNVVIENAFTKDQYKKVGIIINNIDLPTEENPEIKDYVMEVAKNNGYDDFYETHSPFTNEFHKQLKVPKIYRYYFLPYNSSIASKFYKSKSQCENDKKNTISKAYSEASEYVTPGSSKCFAKEATIYYSKVIDRCFTNIMDNLNLYCDISNKKSIFEKIYNIVNKSKNNLQNIFEQEIRDNVDYYKMYELDYFMDQVEIEKNDYRVSEDGIFRLLEGMIADNIEYTISDIYSSISEMENDLNKRANTFFNSVHNEYEKYVNEIEELLELIGKNLKLNENEDIEDCLVRACANKTV